MALEVRRACASEAGRRVCVPPRKALRGGVQKSIFKRPCHFFAMNAPKMAPRTTQWFQDRPWETPTKGLAWYTAFTYRPGCWPHRHTHAHAHAHSLSLTHTHSLSLSLSHTHTHKAAWGDVTLTGHLRVGCGHPHNSKGYGDIHLQVKASIWH